jgi:hypothetical protein
MSLAASVLAAPTVLPLPGVVFFSVDVHATAKNIAVPASTRPNILLFIIASPKDLHLL